MRDAQKGRKSWLERLTSPPEADPDESYPQDAVPGAAQSAQPGPHQPGPPNQSGPNMPPGGPQFGPGPGGMPGPPGQRPGGQGGQGNHGGPMGPDSGPGQMGQPGLPGQTGQMSGPPGPPMNARDAFDTFAPPNVENGMPDVVPASDGDQSNPFAMAFDDHQDDPQWSAGPAAREPWESRDVAEPTDRPPEVKEPAVEKDDDNSADFDPFDLRHEDPPPSTPSKPVAVNEPTDSPPWEREPRVREPRVFDSPSVTDVKDAVKDAPAPLENSVARTEGSDEPTFMSSIDEPVPAGPSEEEQLEAARKRHVEELQQRWLITQAQLLDDPRDAVREAGLLIGDAMQFVTTTFTEHRDRIEREWKDNSDMNTDELRAIMRRYRNLFQYVLSASQLPDL